MILEICTAGKVKQELEHLCPPFTAKWGKSLLLADEWPGMACENLWIKAHTRSSYIKFIGKSLNINRLIMEDKADNVIVRGRIGMAESSRFVNEYT